MWNSSSHGSSSVEPAVRQFMAPCQVKCPIHEDIQRTNVLISQLPFDPAEAQEKLQLIGDYLYERNPFFSVCGYVCGLCELACNYASRGGAIHRRLLKRYVADAYTDRLATREAFAWPADREAVAVVGGGPAGLMAAYDLRRRGYRVTLFEATDQLGGALLLIPHYRLPAQVLTSTLENLVRLAGIDIRYDVKIGESDLTLAKLDAEGFRAVFIAKGSPAPRILSFAGTVLPGQDLSGVMYGHSFLYEVGHDKIHDNYFQNRRVLVVGGGNVAFDAARTAQRLGARTELICLESAAAGERDSIPADHDEVKAACQEGITIHYSRGVREIVGQQGKFTAIECPRCLQVFDDHGFHPRFDLGDSLTLAGDVLIIAVGQQPQQDFLTREGLTNQQGGVAVDPVTLQSLTRDTIFIGGDLRHIGFLAEALRDGLEAAESVERFLRQLDLRVGRTPELVMQGAPLRRDYMHEPEVVWIPPEQRHHFQLFEQGFSHTEAIAEARRCLCCGPCRTCKACLAAGLQDELPTVTLYEESCSGCGICVATCCYGAVQLKSAGGKKRSLTDSFACKACGSCVAICPSGARRLVNDPQEQRFNLVRERLGGDDEDSCNEFRPKLVCFSCLFGWGYQSDREELASRLTNWIPVLCSGQVEAGQILQAFRQGADGVLLLGCRTGECHFQEGNSQTWKRVAILRMLLTAYGIEPERLAVRFSLDPSGETLPDLLGEFSQQLAPLGPALKKES